GDARGPPGRGYEHREAAQPGCSWRGARSTRACAGASLALAIHGSYQDPIGSAVSPAACGERFPPAERNLEPAATRLVNTPLPASFSRVYHSLSSLFCPYRPRRHVATPPQVWPLSHTAS